MKSIRTIATATGLLMLGTFGCAATHPLGPGFVHRTFPIDGGTLACAHRPAPGPALMLIPGTFSDSQVYAETVPVLDRRFNLILIENRGLGASWPPPVNGSIEQCAADALYIADALDVDRFFIGGHSLGGMISIEVGRIATERVLGIISIEGWTSWRAARDAFGFDMSSTLSQEQLDAKAAYRKRVLARWSREEVAAFGKIWRKWDGYAFLEQTELPILELWGDRGKAPRPSLARLLVPERSNIEVMWFKDASHSLLIERPSGIAEAINRFVARVAAGSRISGVNIS